VAPIDSLTAISFRRAVARDSSRLATLAHAMTRTVRTTAVSNVATDVSWARWPGGPSSSRAIVIRGRLSVCLVQSPIPRATPVNAPSACTSDTPGLSRPTPKIQLFVLTFSRSGFCSPE